MKKFITNKKFPIIAIILILGTTLPQLASAGWADELIEDAGLTIVRALSKLLINITTFAVDIANDFFEAMFLEGLKGHQEIAQIGWNVTRDVANMFFILFMVVIAFATILRFERYGIKELLPKVIIIALLINFSMIICYVIIDFSNITAYFFVKDARTAIIGEGEVSLGGILSDSFRLSDLYLPFACEYYQNERDKCYDLEGDTAISGCVEQAERGLNDCWESGGITKTEEDDFWDVVVAGIGSSVILLIAAFILFAGGIMLVIRLIAIWFLVMIVPLAFICYILPGLRRNWEAWWSQFIKWCVFAPVFSFFIWLAAKISLENRLQSFSKLRLSMTRGGGEPVNQFFASTGNILHFLFIGGILIGGLLAANQLGIRAAGTAMTLGKKWTNTAKGWAKKQTVGRAKERVGGGLDRARGAALANVGKLFGNTSIGRSMRARGSMASQSAAQREYNKKYATRLSMMSKDDTLKEVEKASGAQKLLAARTAQNRGFLREAEKEQVASAINAFANFGDVDSSRKLAELRPDAVTGNDRKEAEQRAIASGTHKQWGEKVFEGTDGAEIAEDLREQLGTGEFTKVFNGWAKDVRDKCEKALRSGLTDDFKNADNAKKRKDFASITGKLDQAFYGDKDGKLNTEYSIDSKTKTIKLEWDNLVGSHIRGFKDEDWGKLKSVTDKTLAAKYMTAAQVDGAGPKLSGSDKQFVKNILEELIKTLPDTDPHKAERQKTYEAITASTAWGGKTKTTTIPPPGEEMRKEEQEKRRREYQDYQSKM
jgi:hypothetical protein